jgi:hypothetical protein
MHKIVETVYKTRTGDMYVNPEEAARVDALAVIDALLTRAYNGGAEFTYSQRIAEALADRWQELLNELNILNHDYEEATK